MNSRILLRAFFTAAAFVSFAASVSAAPFVYVVTGSQQFGAVDLATGAFHAIGNPTADQMANLVWGPRDTLYSLAVTGNDAGSLAKIDPRTGVVTDIGQTGLGLNAFSLAAVRGKLYATDFSNNLYSVNRETGEATPVSATGIPPDQNVPFTFNNDGTFNLCDEGFYGIAGELYATFDSFALDVNPTIPTIAHVFVSPALYRIDPSTGEASYVAPVDLQLVSMVEVEGKTYAFHGVLDGFDHTYNFPIAHSELMRFDLANGKTTKVRDIDPSIGPIFGAAPIRSQR
jgi:outer membrane protein assembly factor BamB